MKGPDYFYKLVSNIVIIFDLNMGNMTVTNGIEEVINQIRKNINLKRKIIIYRDSMGEYNRVILNEKNEFAAFEFNIQVSTFAIIGKELLEDIYINCI